MDALFERMGSLYVAAAVLVALLPSRRSRALGAAGLAALGLAVASDRIGGADGGAAFTTVNEALAAAGLVAIFAALLTSRRRFSSAVPVPAIPTTPAPFPDPVLLFGLALAAVAPHLLLFDLGILLAMISAARSALRSRRRWWLLPLLAGGTAMGIGLVLALTILGPEGGPMTALRDGPFSPPAERLLILLLGGGSLLVAGLAPMHRAPWGRQLAPLGAILLLRIGLPVLPGGVAEWQPLAMLLLVVSGITAAVQRRWGELAVAAGLAALWGGQSSGGLPGALLVLWGWLYDLRATGHLAALRSPPERWAGTPALIAALLALPALGAGLRAQVVLSVSLVAAAVIGFTLEWVRRSRAGSSPLY